MASPLLSVPSPTWDDPSFGNAWGIVVTAVLLVPRGSRASSKGRLSAPFPDWSKSPSSFPKPRSTQFGNELGSRSSCAPPKQALPKEWAGSKMQSLHCSAPSDWELSRESSVATPHPVPLTRDPKRNLMSISTPLVFTRRAMILLVET